MGFDISSDFIAKLALWAMSLIIIVNFLMFFQIVGVHAVRVMRQRHRRRFVKTWRPIMVQSLSGEVQEIPPLGKHDLVAFMGLFNRFHESLRGESKNSLNRLARMTSIGTAALRMLQKGGMRNRMLAIATLGQLRERSAWDALRGVLTDANPFISLAAAIAMVRISAEDAAPLLISQIASRTDWPQARVAGLLKEAGVDIVSGQLSEAILKAPLDKAPHLIRYLSIIHYNDAKKIVNMLLTTHADAEIVSGCLKIVKDPGMLDVIRRYSSHDCWFVRAQVASALGRLGTEEDLERLCLLLADSHWWVRYRAARALANLPFVTMDDLRGLSVKHFDRYSRDILKQVIAEKEVP